MWRCKRRRKNFVFNKKFIETESQRQKLVKRKRKKKPWRHTQKNRKKKEFRISVQRKGIYSVLFFSLIYYFLCCCLSRRTDAKSGSSWRSKCAIYFTFEHTPYHCIIKRKLCVCVQCTFYFYFRFEYYFGHYRRNNYFRPQWMCALWYLVCWSMVWTRTRTLNTYIIVHSNQRIQNRENQHRNRWNFLLNI